MRGDRRRVTGTRCRLALLAATVLTAAAGCGEGSGASDKPGLDAEGDRPAVDAGADAQIDAGADALVNAGTDAQVDAGIDARVDAGSDAQVDAESDAQVDTGADGLVDAGTDARVDTGADALVDAAALEVGRLDAADALTADTANADAANPDGGQAGDASSPADGGRPGIMVVATYLGGIYSFVVDASGAPTPAGAALDTGAQFYAVTAHPSGSFVYAADFRGRVYGYHVNRDDGTLAAVPNSPLIIGGQAVTEAIDPQGRVLYVGNSGDDHLYVYSIESTTGALTAVDGSPFALGAVPAGIAFHPTAALAFVSSAALSAAGGGGIHVFNLDASGRPAGEIADSPFFPTLFGGALVMHPSGKFLYDSAFGVHTYTIAGGGALTEPESPQPGAASDNSAIDIAVDPSGQHLYASSNVTATVTAYDVDATTGAFTHVEGSPFDAGPMAYSVAVDRAGRFLYVGNDDADEVSVFPLDPATGALRLPITASPVVVHGLQPEIVLIGP
jgi:6-phosphogluconolactonase (cycloisomerase 2 family)